jgi:Gas vesicle synthesis protein GvpL/GvpF
MAGPSRKPTGAGSGQAKAGTRGSGKQATKTGARGSGKQATKTGAGGSGKQATKTGGRKQQTAKAASGKRAAGSAGAAGKATGSSQAKRSQPKRQAAQRNQPSTSAGGSKRQESKSRASSEQQKGIYVYGVLPADVQLTGEMTGVGDPPGQVRVVHADGVAALVSDVDVAKPLGSPEDLIAHQQILDAIAAEVPVLPARFGAVLASEEEVTYDLLGANRDEFADSLTELDGLAQYVVKGRYVEQAILEEVLSENRQAARLRDKLRGADPDATRNIRIKLGEIINEAVTAKRHRDTRDLGDAMEGCCVASVVREPTHELDAAHVAFLVETGRESELVRVAEELARDWEGRIELRLLGPMAAYDFAGTVLAEA